MKSPCSVVRKKHSNAFTLTEILVVLVIVAVLAALIIPMSSKMIAQSRTAKCASNLRQMYLASIQWSNDNQNWMLFCLPSPSLTFEMALRPYMNIAETWPSAQTAGKRPPEAYACPASKDLSTASRFSDYGMNIEVNYSHPDDPRGRLYRDKKYRWASFSQASKVIFLADSFTREIRWDMTPTARITGRHNGKANILFWDGHIECLDPKKLTFASGTAPPWQPNQ